MLHQCSMHGWHGFAPQAFAEEPLIRAGSVVLQHTWRIELRASSLTLHDHAHGRDSAPVVLAVPHDRWARIRCNRREQSYDSFWYAELTLNFGGFASQPDVDVFLGEPDLSLDLRRDLLRRERRHLRP